MGLNKRLGAEYIGTFWLVFGGCGSAVLAAAFPELGIGFTGVALAFGLTVLTMAYAVGHISGGHFNPAVTVGLAVGKRFPAKEILPYAITQVVAAVAAAAVLYVIASGNANFSLAGGFASNGYGEHSPGGYSLLSCLVAEVVLTYIFLIVILGSTDKRAPAGFAPIAIGLALSLIHLIGIPVTKRSQSGRSARSSPLGLDPSSDHGVGDACRRYYCVYLFFEHPYVAIDNRLIHLRQSPLRFLGVRLTDIEANGDQDGQQKIDYGDQGDRFFGSLLQASLLANHSKDDFCSIATCPVS